MFRRIPVMRCRPRCQSVLNPDSPDEMAFGPFRLPIYLTESIAYAGSSSRFLTDATGESKESAVSPAFPRLSVLPTQSIRGIRVEQVLTNIAFVGVELADQVPGH